MVNGNAKTILGMFLVTLMLKQRFQRLLQPSSGSAKTQPKYLCLQPKSNHLLNRLATSILLIT